MPNICGSCGHGYGSKHHKLRSLQCREEKFKRDDAERIGTKFGKLKVSHYLRTELKRGRIYHCDCRCTGYTEVAFKDFGGILSCGCERIMSKPDKKNKTYSTVIDKRFLGLPVFL